MPDSIEVTLTPPSVLARWLRERDDGRFQAAATEVVRRMKLPEGEISDLEREKITGLFEFWKVESQARIDAMNKHIAALTVKRAALAKKLSLRPWAEDRAKA